MLIPSCKVEKTQNMPLYDVRSKKLYAGFCEYASFMDNKEILTKLAGGDLIASEAKYHNTYGTMYSNSIKSKIQGEQSTFQSIKKFRYSALLDLVNELG